MRKLRNEKSLKKTETIKVNDILIPVYQDEVHFQLQTTVTVGWFKKGSNPKVKSFPGRLRSGLNLTLNWLHFALLNKILFCVHYNYYKRF